MDKAKKARRLLKLARVVRRNPDHFDMGTWGRIVDEDETPRSPDDPAEMLRLLAHQEDGIPVSCGTTACLGGWATAIWPKEAIDCSNFLTVGVDVLGLELHQAEKLFNGSARWQQADRAADLLEDLAAATLKDDDLDDVLAEHAGR